MINNLNINAKLRNKFHDQIQFEKYEEILSNAKMIKHNILEEFPYDREFSIKKAAKLQKEVDKLEYAAKNSRNEFLEN